MHLCAMRAALRLPSRAGAFKSTPNPLLARGLAAGAPLADIEWDKLRFSYTPTKSHLRFTWRDGCWDDGELVESPFQSIHVLSGALHYGQTLFEGLKAFRGVDGNVRVFNSNANSHRLQNGMSRFLMPEIPQAMFNEAIDRVVRDNLAFVPPASTGGSMYIRPNVFGSGPVLGVQAAPEYTLNIVVTPVGPYYKGGGLEPVDALVITDYDRAAPKGVGAVKCGGNYAADLYPAALARSRGFPICLYLDPKTHSYVEEFSTSNFIGITKEGKYITPKSDSILPSTTTRFFRRSQRIASTSRLRKGP